MDASEHERRARLARIESLRQSSAWDDLTSMFEEVEAKFWKRHIADLKNGAAVDQRKLDRALGKFDGIRDVCAAPAKAAQKLERTIGSNEQEKS